MSPMKDESCPSCGNDTLFRTTYEWYKCRHCFYAESKEKHDKRVLDSYDTSKQTTPKCPECGNSEHYRIIYTNDEKTDVKFYDCMVCHTHWDKDGKNLGKF